MFCKLLHGWKWLQTWTGYSPAPAANNHDGRIKHGAGGLRRAPVLIPGPKAETSTWVEEAESAQAAAGFIRQCQMGFRRDGSTGMARIGGASGV